MQRKIVLLALIIISGAASSLIRSDPSSMNGSTSLGTRSAQQSEPSPLESPLAEMQHFVDIKAPLPNAQSFSLKGVQTIVQDFRFGRRSAFFNSAHFALKSIESNPGFLTQTRQLLESNSGIDSFSNGETVIQIKPEGILNRMAAIDLLETLAQQSQDHSAANEARQILADLVSGEISNEWTAGQKKIILAEKRDALVALNRVSHTEAIRALLQVRNLTIQEILKRAAVL